MNLKRCSSSWIMETTWKNEPPNENPMCLSSWKLNPSHYSNPIDSMCFIILAHHNYLIKVCNYYCMYYTFDDTNSSFLCVHIYNSIWSSEFWNEVVINCSYEAVKCNPWGYKKLWRYEVRKLYEAKTCEVMKLRSCESNNDTSSYHECIFKYHDTNHSGWKPFD